MLSATNNENDCKQDTHWILIGAECCQLILEVGEWHSSKFWMIFVEAIDISRLKALNIHNSRHLFSN